MPTTDPTARVQVSVVQVCCQHCTPAQLQLLENTFLHPQGISGLTSVMTSLGIGVSLEPSSVDQPLTVISIPDGQFDLHRSDVMNYCTLERLGCIRELTGSDVSTGLAEVLRVRKSSQAEVELAGESSHWSIVRLETLRQTLTESFQAFSTLFEVKAETTSASLRKFMEVLTFLLQILGYLSTLPEFDFTYCELIRNAVLRFQQDHNAPGSDKLPETGDLGTSTWLSLRRLLTQQLEGLHRLGFWFTGDPFSPRPAEQERLRCFVDSCQRSLGVEVVCPGTMGRKTREEIESCVRGLTSDWQS